MVLKNKNKGFTLIELILVMGLSTTALLSYLKYESSKADQKRAEIAGQQFKDVGDALTTYLSKEAGALLANVPNNTTVSFDIKLLRNINSDNSTGSANCYPTVPTVLCGRPYLPSTFSNTNAFGSQYTLQVRNESSGITGLVMSSTAVCKERTIACGANNPVRLDLAGYAVRAMGSNGGLIASGTNVTGYNAGWSETSTRFNGLTSPGQIAFRAGSSLISSITYDNMYLKLDGTNMMKGNLNVGNWDINNATNITYNGWLSGYGILANTLQTGTINNSGNIQTANLWATNNITAENDLSVGNNITAGNNINATNRVGGANYVYSGSAVVDPYGTLVNGAGDVTAQRYVVGDDGVISNSFMNANGEIKSESRVVALQDVTTKDIYLGSSNTAAPTATKTGRTIPNVWLSDLLPRYSSRGIRSIQIPANNTYTLAKPDCGSGTAKLEIIPQGHITLGYVNGSIAVAITEVGASNTNNLRFDISADLKSVTSNQLSASSSGNDWILSYITFDSTSSAMTTLTHIYCDFNF